MRAVMKCAPDCRVPAESFSATSHLNEELEARGWGVEDLAVAMGEGLSAIDEVRGVLENEDRWFDEDFARGLSRAFGTSAELWMNLQYSRLHWLLHDLWEKQHGEEAPDA